MDTMPQAAIYASQQDIFQKEENVAPYKGAKWNNVVMVKRGISVQEAHRIAEANPEVDHFMYVKGYTMVLELPSNVVFDAAQEDPFGLVTNSGYIFDNGETGNGLCRIFHQGDVVFFSKGEGRWFGSAPSLADTYTKKSE